MSVAPPLFTVVVPVLNDAARLRRCLAALHANAQVPFNLVVVDNGSDDDSAEVARACGATVLSLPGRTVGALRNVGARTGWGPLLAFVDADNLVPPDWLHQAHRTLHASGAAAVGADYRSERRTWVQRGYDTLRRRPASLTPANWLPSGSLVVARAAFDEAGGFDETLDACEDVDLCRRLRLRGHLIVSSPDLSSLHLGDPSTLSAVLRGEAWRGRNNLRVSLRAPVAWRSVAGACLSACVAASLPLAGALAVCGLPIVGAALLAACAALVAAKTIRACHAQGITCVRDMAAAGAVFACYEVGRGLALVWPASHARRRTPSRTPAWQLP